MTKSLHTLFLLLVSCYAWSQGAPALISYQAALRDLQGSVVTNQSVSIEFAIRTNGVTGEIVFEENHPMVTTSMFGVFTAQIGAGIPTGTAIYTGLDEIPWHENTYFIEVRAVLPGQSEPLVLGVSQLLSVPYAMHSQTATTVINETDGSITNETISNITFDGTNLIFHEGDSNFSYNVTGLLALVSGDNDTSNEIIDTLSAIDQTTLQIEEGDNVVVGDVSAISYATWNESGAVVYNLDQQIGIRTATPTSDFHANGSQSVAFRTIQGDSNTPGPTVDQLQPNDYVILCDITSEDITVTLPDAGICAGRIYKIRKFSTSPSSYDVNIVPISGQLIEGINNYTMTWPLAEYLTVMSTGVSWMLIDHSKE